MLSRELAAEKDTQYEATYVQIQILTVVYTAQDARVWITE